MSFSKKKSQVVFASLLVDGETRDVKIEFFTHVCMYLHNILQKTQSI